jgi:hypothetical protein
MSTKYLGLPMKIVVPTEYANRLGEVRDLQASYGTTVSLRSSAAGSTEWLLPVQAQSSGDANCSSRIHDPG